MSSSLYDTDFYEWCLEQSQLLETHSDSHLDYENLKEEILSLGRREFRELRAFVVSLMQSLLKYSATNEDLTALRYKNDICSQRYEIKLILKDSPSLKEKLNEVVDELWLRAIQDTQEIEESYIKEIQRKYRWSIDQLLDESFFPKF